jgi:catechol 2,3-dioxygenase-like lactoylglutathione lyase family enzyme
MLRTNFYHIGILVPNLQEAIAYYQKKLTIDFADIATTDLRLSNPETGVAEIVPVAVTYSRTKAPYIELIEAVGDGAFSKINSGRILYYGYWEKDIPKRIRRLKREGVVVDAIIDNNDDIPTAIITAPDQYGVRIEYVTDKIQGYVKAWILTGKVPGNHWWATALAGIFSVYYFVKQRLS